jgi:hypothetical protein
VRPISSVLPDFDLSPLNKQAPSSDGIKDLRPLTRSSSRAILDPAAYLEALTREAERLKKKDQE